MSFPKYPEYKDSGIEWLGEVPAYWCIQPLKRQCDVMPSNVDKKSVEDERPVLLCNYTDVYYHDEIVQGMCFMKATASGSQVEKFSLLAGDVIFTKDSESSDDIAIAAHVPEALPGVVCGYHLSIARPHPSIIGRFLKHYFDSDSAKSYFNVSANGLTRVGLSQYASDNLPTPLPPVEEQDTIAAFLDHETARIDSLVEQQQRLIELLKEKRQAVISHAVTKGLDPDVPMKDSGVEWLGEVPAHWEVCKITHHLSSIVDYRGRTPEKDTSGVFLVTAKNIKNGFVDYEASEEYITEKAYCEVVKRGHPKVGDVVFTTEAPLGQVANLDRDDIALAQRVIKFRGVEGKVCNQFLKFWIMGDFCQAELGSLATGSTALGIKGSKINQLSFCMPSFNEQQAIVSWVSDKCHRIDELISSACTSMNLLEERRSALISAAVTGKIDVRGWKAEQHSEQPEVLMAAEERATYA